jgi:hypothetical protein
MMIAEMSLIGFQPEAFSRELSAISFEQPAFIRLTLSDS